MNSFGKNKGLIIELTSLLDVILIMLFWVMMNFSAKAEQAQENARTEIENANSQLEQIREEAESGEEKLKSYIEAAEGFENGGMLSVYIKSSGASDELSFVMNGEEFKSAQLNGGSSDIEGIIGSVFEEASQGGKKIVLAALIYDGDTVLYRSVALVRSALESVSEDYENIYLAYINTSL